MTKQFEGLRTIDKPEQPTNSSPTAIDKNTIDIKPKTGSKKQKNADQAPEQPICERCQQANCQCRAVLLKEKSLEQPMNRKEAEKCARKYFKTTEQPNPSLLIVKKIQSLMSEVSENLDELDKNIQFLSCDKPLIVRQAHKDISQLIENVDMFEKTTLYDLQKTFE